ncbi:hypothetical protein NC652_013596 [Populus alba x Populus x berolinensis]|nr:hypothetical protein NC652_013596 [Populus alba x Populus x berolinensis]
MKQTKVETGDVCGKITQSIPPPPPPLPPLPRFWVRKKVTESVTKQEIAKFWRKKLTEEEDHFLAAIKAAARIRARNLSEDGYKQFEESLKDDDGAKENDTTSLNSGKDTRNNEVRVGIKDWWTKSKYAYLNQPAIKSKDPPNRRSSSYTPNYFSFKPTTPLFACPAVAVTMLELQLMQNKTGRVSCFELALHYLIEQERITMSTTHLQRFWARKSAVGESVTKRAIAEFWRQKLVDEQDHLLYAIKAAARLRAHNLSEDDYRLFEESLKDEDDIKENESTEYGKNSEMRLGINDWWTKSKYAYLNQPAIDDESLDPPKKAIFYQIY